MARVFEKLKQVMRGQADRHGIIQWMIIYDPAFHHLLIQHKLHMMLGIIDESKWANRAGADAQKLP